MLKATRRRTLGILAAAAGLPLGIAAVRAMTPEARVVRWDGDVLGAKSGITLWHWDEPFARRTLLKAGAEIARLESIVSLYRAGSEIARLNRDGALARPSRELVALIEESQRLGALSGGAFDITVQPLWQVYARHFWSREQVEADIAARAADVARALVDFSRIDAGASRVSFARPGMAITLNGIAQGFITDRIADLLRHEGFDRAVVDLGETRVLGRHPENRAWRAALRSGQTLDLADNALAVSGGYGTPFEPSGRFHHIFDPASGTSADTLAEAAVIAPRATIADALATAICVMGEERGRQLLAHYPGARTLVMRKDTRSIPLVPAKAGTQSQATKALDARLRGHERI